MRIIAHRTIFLRGQLFAAAFFSQPYLLLCLWPKRTPVLPVGTGSAR